MKKIFSIILSLALVLSLAVGASAATITIPSELVSTNGTESGETLVAYKVLDADISADGSKFSYTIDSESNPFWSVINNGTYFTTSLINNSGTVYNVTANADFTDEDDAKTLATALNAVSNKGTGITATYAADGNYTIIATDPGYYLITDSLGTALIVDTVGGDVTLDMKNAYPSVTKKIVDGNTTVDSITTDRGATITFQITVNIPTTVNGNIIIHDTLDEDMAYAALTAAPGVTKIDDCSDATCTANVHFEIDYDAVSKDTSGNTTFTYTATLNADAETATAHPNTAWLTYSSFTSTTSTVNVYTYKMDIYKWTGNESTGLAGAGFKLKNAAGNYYKNTNGVVTWVTENEQPTEYTTTEENGYTITFAGLANGTYTLVESTVPQGYNKSNDQTITIEDADMTGDTKIGVENSTGSELPSTGGMGTTIFYILGGMLTVGAAVLLVTKKRMA